MLENHIAWVHDGEKPHECPFCKKCHLTHEKVIAHVKSAHNRFEKARNWLKEQERSNEILVQSESQQIETDSIFDSEVTFEEPAGVTNVRFSKVDLPKKLETQNSKINAEHVSTYALWIKIWFVCH